MNLYRTVPVKCAVCGAQANYHASWFLVVENRWLDHLKILSWHPRLAEQPEMHSVCGDQHLRILLQQWLTEANLNLHDGEKIGHPALCEFEPRDRSPLAVGSLLGELAVQRHPLSHVWTGSPEALESILSAITGREPKPRAAGHSLASFHARRADQLSRAQAAGWA